MLWPHMLRKGKTPPKVLAGQGVNFPAHALFITLKTFCDLVVNMKQISFHHCRLVCPSGIIASYLHASSSPGLGKMGALVAITGGKGALEREKATKAKVACPDMLCHTCAILLSVCYRNEKCCVAETHVLWPNSML